MQNYVRTEIAESIATVALNDPFSSVNTVSPTWIDEMLSVFEGLKNNSAVTGVIITSDKPGFMAGADLHHILAESAHMSQSEGFAFSQRATRMHRLIETCGKPVIAAMNGFALGGGYELALACTYRLLADDAKAVVGLPEVKVGLLPGSGGTQRLLRLVGLKRASEVLLEGKSYLPAQALAMGLVDAIVPEASLLDAARVWLASDPDPTRPWDVKGFELPESDGLLKQSTATFFTLATGKLLAKYGNNYPAPIAILACLFEGAQAPFDRALLVESRYFAKLISGSVARNIIRTTFVNRGLAEKGARRPAAVPRAAVRKIGIIGAGMMGAGIAYDSAKVGIEVVLLDTEIEAALEGKGHTAKLLSKALERGVTTQDQIDAHLGRITPTADYADFEGVDLVIEAVFEDTAVKAAVTQSADQVIPRTALFASNTSTLPISQLAQAFSRQEDFIGLHFFSPVDRMALVEIILGRKTGKVALARAIDFVRQIRKVPIVVNDSRGFYTSRVFQTFIHEGMELVREGVAPALIENAAKQAGLPVGPLAVIDEVSLELPMKIVLQSEKEDTEYNRPSSMEVMEKMVDGLRRLGRKGRGGFYDYPEGGAKKLWPDLAKHFPLAAEQPSVAEVKTRLLYIQALETARCLEEGVLTHPADGDLGAVLGWGFPAWTGGTLSLIETVGVGEFVAACDDLARRCGPRFTPTVQLRTMAAEDLGFDRS